MSDYSGYVRIRSFWLLIDLISRHHRWKPNLVNAKLRFQVTSACFISIFLRCLKQETWYKKLFLVLPLHYIKETSEYLHIFFNTLSPRFAHQQLGDLVSLGFSRKPEKTRKNRKKPRNMATWKPMSVFGETCLQGLAS
jgi:hypothetical protein